jgi:hypothetical protein
MVRRYGGTDKGLAALSSATPPGLSPQPVAPPCERHGMTTPGADDFAFIQGSWTVSNRKLRDVTEFNRR